MFQHILCLDINRRVGNMISLPDIFLKTQQFTNPQTQKLDYNTTEMKIYNINYSFGN